MHSTSTAAGRQKNPSFPIFFDEILQKSTGLQKNRQPADTRGHGRLVSGHWTTASRGQAN